MSDISKKESLEVINDFLKKVEIEEHNHNWGKAIEILKNIEKIHQTQPENFKEKIGEAYYKLGEIYQIAADFEKTEENVLNDFKFALEYYQKAYKIFTQLQIEEKIKGTLGFIDILKYISEAEKGKEKLLLESAKKNFHDAKILNTKKGNGIESLKMAVLENRTQELIFAEKCIRNDKNANFDDLSLEFKITLENIWDELRKEQNVPEICFYHFLISIEEYTAWLIVYSPIDKKNIKQHVLNWLELSDELISKFKKSNKLPWLFFSYAANLFFNFIFSAYFALSQFEQKKYLNRAQKAAKKGDEFLSKSIPVSGLIFFYYSRFSTAMFLISIGFFAKDVNLILQDLEKSINASKLHFPKIMAAHGVFYSAFTFMIGAMSRATLSIQRVEFANRILDMLTNFRIPIMIDPNYILYNQFYKALLCVGHIGLGDIFEDIKRNKHLQSAIEYFNEISNYIGVTKERSYNYSHVFGYCYPRIGLLLAKHSKDKSEKVNYLKKSLEFFLKKHIYEETWYYIENLFMIGETYYELGILTNGDMFNKGIVAYNDAITFCKDQGYSNLVGSGYIYLAQIEDRLCNYTAAADNYKKASDAFDRALMTLTYIKAGKTINKLKSYVNAWEIIEIAKNEHTNENHIKAQENYVKASQILNKIREYKYESPFYSAWSILEKAEDISKRGMYQEAAETYLEAKKSFENAIQNLDSFLKKKSPENIERIQKLIQVGETRKNYCTARHHIETARIESKNGNHLLAAELYNKASSLFETICHKFKIKREKDELTATLYLCKAWENMEKAELKQDSKQFAIASYLFNKASENFPTVKMKKLSLGNSIFCSALENRILFDKSTDLNEKTNFYKKIKTFLREASKNYQLGGFKEDAKWALATGTYFDGLWHLIQADNELDFTKKNRDLNVATNYLTTAQNLFSEVGSKRRSEEISQYLDMIKKEKMILTTASNIIEKPAISASSIGISAPSCPIEISTSANIEEMQLTDFQTESEKNWYKRLHHIYLFLPQGESIYQYPFKSGVIEESEAQFVSGGLAGLFELIKEVTKSETKIKIIEQEELSIILEHGNYVSAALIAEENLKTLRNKLKDLINDVEDFFSEELENFQGDIRPFSKIDKFVQKIFKK